LKRGGTEEAEGQKREKKLFEPPISPFLRVSVFRWLSKTALAEY